MSENAERIERNREIIDQFRASGGEVAGYEGTPLLLLTTTGARSGEPRVSPVAHIVDAGRWIVFGANGGRDHDPAWCHNLAADPHASVEPPDDHLGPVAVVARFAEGDERIELWAKGVAAMPMFEQFATATSRVIPVVVLEPSDRSR